MFKDKTFIVKRSQNAGKIAMESSKQSLSLDSRGESSSTPLASKGKQIVQGQGEVFTHFVSFPLAIYPELRKKLEAFRNSILGDNDNLKFKGTTLAEMGIDKSIFVSPNTLHLTVVMLKLENKEAVDAALNILKSISSNVRHVLDNRPVYIRLKGLNSMNDSFDKTRVLYAPVEEVGNEGRLLSACHVIIDAFANAGFAGKDAKSRLKLHATVMNSSYRKGGKNTFDAQEIHKEFGNKNWGKYLIREAHISKRSWIDRVFVFTSRCFQSKPETFSFMSYRGNAAMEGSKKQKMVNLVWRPISTHSSSIVAEAGNNVQEAQCSKSSDVCEEVSQGEVNETVSVVSDGKHSVSLEVGSSLIKFIRGKEGTTQMKIEEEMGVKIILPSSRNEDNIIIEGGSLDCVTKASERIATIIDEVVKSPSLDYSHFVSLPLAIHPELVDKLMNFQNSILGNHGIAGDEQDDQANISTTSVAVDLRANSETNQVNVDIKSIPIVSYQPKAKETKSSTLYDLGIEKSIFIKPNTFHLTVLMLKLWNKDRVNAARDVLKSISPSVMDALDNRPLFIRLKGLDCMRGPLAKARVLYVPVEEIGDEGRLLRACQVITEAFVKAGLVLEKDAKQSLKLHATVINARHRKRKDKRKKMETFDAREIHKQFGNEDWGEYLIREAHLSQRFVFDQSGYYRCCGSIPFPEEHRA
ncbi:unnamed protein product [Arabis nemorensis]|uniref:K Homology domain-containing protein n=1 Tax=Arabis nemorensis TaxID=586526 RepID=A0A565BA79_9BRAS|nr:unnamed protein product [Arabis nemorensis]